MQQVLVRPRALVRGLSRALVLHPPRLRRTRRAGARRNGRHGLELALLSLAVAGPVGCKLEGETATSALKPNASLPSAPADSAARSAAPRRAANAAPAARDTAAWAVLPAAAPEARLVEETGNREANGPVSVYLAGDGSVKADAAAGRDQLGWGQLLERYTGLDVRLDNRAVEGRSARRFIDEGRLDEILSALLPGDYLLIGFGTSDADRSASYLLGDERVAYYLDPATDFKAYLSQYIEGARERGAYPVLVTPPATPSVHCSGTDAAEPQARAIRELGRARTVPVVDLNADSATYLARICPAPPADDFFASEPDGSTGLHVRENGARILAGFVAGQLGKIEPALLRSMP